MEEGREGRWREGGRDDGGREGGREGGRVKDKCSAVSSPFQYYKVANNIPVLQSSYNLSRGNMFKVGPV